MGSHVEAYTFMREQIKKVYPGPKWAKRVNLMAPDQVYAVYVKLKREQKIRS